MAVVVSGSDLTLDEVVRVARARERVELAAGVHERMAKARGVVERSWERGDEVYGLSTGLGVLKRAAVEPETVDAFNRRLLDLHRIGQGALYAPDVVRAGMLRLVNHFALGTVGVRPELADRVVETLNGGDEPPVHVLGHSLMHMAEMAEGALGDFRLAPGEGLAMIGNAALDTGYAALALWDAWSVAEAMDGAAAVSLEAFGGNLSSLHAFAVGLRGQEGVMRSAGTMRRLLAGSYLWQAGAARNLQDPLTFRCAPGVDGALWDALDHARRVLAVELDSGQGNPVVVVSEDRVVSVGNFELQTLTAALDLARISLATALTSSQERSIKLLDTQWSGLSTGLVGDAEASDSGLAMYQILVQRLVAEARALAHPVSTEGPSTSCAEGIEDRYNWTSLAAGKLDELVRLGELVVAVELLVGAQASELRGRTPLGDGTGEIVRGVRELVPFATATEATPSDLDGLTALIRARTLSSSSAAQDE